MGATEDILRILLEPKFRHNGVWVSRVGLPTFLTGYKKKTITNSINYLKSKKYIALEADSIKILPNGKHYLKRRQALLRVFDSPFSPALPKNLLLVFDIPEARKAEREWFRKQLKIFGYAMIQKSVWVGPSPLPKEFISYIKSINLEEGIKTFKLAHGYKKFR